MKQELPANVIWLEDADRSRYVRQYDFKAFRIGDVATWYDYVPGEELDYDTAVTGRVGEDGIYGEVVRLV